MRVRSDLSGAQGISAILSDADYFASQTVNRAAVFTKDTSARRISDRLNLMRTYVDGKLRVRRAPPRRPTAEVQAIDQPIQLRQYDARQEFAGGKRQGVSFQILKSGARATVRRAFFAQLKNGAGIGVFIRLTNARSPLRLLYGATPGQMFKLVTADLTPELSRRIEAELASMFDERTTASFSTTVTRR